MTAQVLARWDESAAARSRRTKQMRERIEWRLHEHPCGQYARPDTRIHGFESASAVAKVERKTERKIDQIEIDVERKRDRGQGRALVNQPGHHLRQTSHREPRGEDLRCPLDSAHRVDWRRLRASAVDRVVSISRSLFSLPPSPLQGSGGDSGCACAACSGSLGPAWCTMHRAHACGKACWPAACVSSIVSMYACVSGVVWVLGVVCVSSV